MPLLRHLCITASTSSSPSNPTTSTTISSSSSSSSSSGVSTISSSSSSAAADSSSISLLQVTSLHPISSSSSPAAIAATSTSLLVASSASISLHDLISLHPISAGGSAASGGAVKSVAAIPGGAVTAHQDGHLRLWRQSTNSTRLRLAASLPTLADRVRRYPLPSNHVSVRRHHCRLWIEHVDAVSSVAVAGDLLFSASWDKTLKIWHLPSLRCVQSLTAHDDAVNAVAVSPDGTVYTGSADRRIRVWARSGKSLGSHALVATLEKHRGAVNTLAVGCGGHVLYSGGNDRSIVVWQRQESANHMIAIGALRGHLGAVLCVACVDDLVFSGSADRTVRIWRYDKGRKGYICLGIMDGHVSAVRSVATERMPRRTEADGGEDVEYRVCSGSLDGEVRVWQVRVLDPSGSILT